jgi:translation initiation factor IF-2
MAEEKLIRLSQAARKLNVGHNTILDFLGKKGFEVENNPNAKLTPEQFAILSKEFASMLEAEKEKKKIEEEERIMIKNLGSKDVKAKEESKPEKVELEKPKLEGIKVLGKIELDKKSVKEEPPVEKPVEKKPVVEAPKVVVPAPAPKEATIEAKTKESVAAVTPPVEPTPAPKVEPAPIVVETKPAKEEEKPVQKEATPVAPVAPIVEPAPVAPTPPVAPVTPTPTVVVEKAPEQELELIKAKADRLKGLKVVDKIQLPVEKKKDSPVASSDTKDDRKGKRPRKRIETNDQKGQGNQQGQGQGHHQHNRQGGGPNQNHQRGGNSQHRGGKPGFNAPRAPKAEPTEKEIQDQIRATLAKLSGGGQKKATGSKYRREKRQAYSDAQEQKMLQDQESSKILRVNEFISANDLASLMDVSVNDVISTCLSLGMFVSINQRLDAESITVIADEFGYEVQFSSEDDVVEEEAVENEADLKPRAPIVTIMGHVDHGKTSLLDYIRNTKVTASEAGGITQHIGAYDVVTKSGNKIAFLDTPGHEAFTAMRARGAKLTDIAIIVVAADDDVMPQTKEAINHAQVAGVPIVIAINKIDKPSANPDKIREALSKHNILVEEWGGKYQCQEISAKSGQGIEDLLEKVLLEAEILNLKANPDKPASGSVIEASLDKGRGYVATIMVQSGTLKVGDVVLAGAHYGRVKAMFDDTGKKVKEVGPSTPAVILGLDGAPQAGDKIQVMESDREAREQAAKRSQLLREQSIRTKKHITLDEIGRRLAIGSFKELNVIVKGDVDGSVEALSDSLLKLSTPEIQVSIIHRGVGQISESDVLLASASDAIIVGFQVRPSGAAKRLAENEEIEIRLYSIIYDAIDDVKAAMEGMLAPETEEVIVGNAEVREVFKISKVGTIAGCMVTDGSVKRSNPIRIIRDGIVTYSGKLSSLKRHKDDASEVRTGFDCGISIDGFNDILIGDVIESYEQREVKRTL